MRCCTVFLVGFHRPHIGRVPMRIITLAQHWLAYICILVGIVVSSAARGADIWVDPDGGGDHTTISAAIAAANHNDNIHITGATYTECPTMNKSLVLSGAGVDCTVVDFSGCATGLTVINAANGIVASIPMMMGILLYTMAETIATIRIQ